MSEKEISKFSKEIENLENEIFALNSSLEELQAFDKYYSELLQIIQNKLLSLNEKLRELHAVSYTHLTLPTN